MPEKTITLNIPTPCHEKWNEMAPVEKGRFCASCEKTVIDFTRATDKEIFQHFQSSSGNGTCGRVYQHQLNRPLRPFYQKSRSLAWLKMAASLLIGGSLIKGAKGQGADSVQVSTDNTPQKAEQATFRQMMISGVVTDSTSGKPLTHTRISIDSIDIFTDSTGYYQLNGIFGEDTAVLLVWEEGKVIHQQTLIFREFPIDHSCVLEVNIGLQKSNHAFEWELLEQRADWTSLPDLMLSGNALVTMGFMTCKPDSTSAPLHTLWPPKQETDSAATQLKKTYHNGLPKSLPYEKPDSEPTEKPNTKGAFWGGRRSRDKG